MPHEPQLFSSVCRSTHDVPQHWSEPGSVVQSTVQPVHCGAVAT
jgi:hypothetical protein